MADQPIYPPLTLAPAVDLDSIGNWPKDTGFLCRTCDSEVHIQDGDSTKLWGCAKCRYATLCVSIYFRMREEAKAA